MKPGAHVNQALGSFDHGGQNVGRKSSRPRHNKQVTSIQNELKHPVNIELVKEILKQKFERVFDAKIISGIFC